MFVPGLQVDRDLVLKDLLRRVHGGQRDLVPHNLVGFRHDAVFLVVAEIGGAGVGVDQLVGPLRVQSAIVSNQPVVLGSEELCDLSIDRVVGSLEQSCHGMVFGLVHGACESCAPRHHSPLVVPWEVLHAGAGRPGGCPCVLLLIERALHLRRDTPRGGRWEVPRGARALDAADVYGVCVANCLRRRWLPWLKRRRVEVLAGLRAGAHRPAVSRLGILQRPAPVEEVELPYKQRPLLIRVLEVAARVQVDLDADIELDRHAQRRVRVTAYAGIRAGVGPQLRHEFRSQRGQAALEAVAHDRQPGLGVDVHVDVSRDGDGAVGDRGLLLPVPAPSEEVRVSKSPVQRAHDNMGYRREGGREGGRVEGGREGRN